LGSKAVTYTLLVHLKNRQIKGESFVEEKLNAPDFLKYNKMDEWVRVEGDTVTIGITDYAQNQLSDVVFAEVKVSAGDMITQGKLIAIVESVKASSDITAPLSGKVLEVNDELVSSPEIINSDPYGSAWLIKVQISKPAELADLLDSGSYLEFRNQ
jgi:glycine cleavage system H protein